MTYDDVIAALMTLNEVPLNGSDENFQRVIPAMMLYADGRIYRDLTFLATTTTQPARLRARYREMVLPSTVRVLRNINLCKPVNVLGTSNVFAINTERTPLERIPAEVLDFFWPKAAETGPPVKYTVLGFDPGQDMPQQHIVRFMPTPDQPYAIELLGEIRPAPLSPENPETYLSVIYSELLICACMIFAAGYQRDFGAQADDPARAASWEGQYNYLKTGILLEVARMRGEGSAPLPVPA